MAVCIHIISYLTYYRLSKFPYDTSLYSLMNMVHEVTISVYGYEHTYIYTILENIYTGMEIIYMTLFHIVFICTQSGLTLNITLTKEESL